MLTIDVATGKVVVSVSEAFYRPTDVVDLWGYSTKAKQELGWNPQTTSFEELVEIMVRQIWKGLQPTMLQAECILILPNTLKGASSRKYKERVRKDGQKARFNISTRYIIASSALTVNTRK